MYRKKMSIARMFLVCLDCLCQLAVPLLATVRHDPVILVMENVLRSLKSCTPAFEIHVEYIWNYYLQAKEVKSLCFKGQLLYRRKGLDQLNHQVHLLVLTGPNNRCLQQISAIHYGVKKNQIKPTNKPRM